MMVLATVGGLFLIFIVLWDAFETIILSRRVSRKFRLTRLFYALTWAPWAAAARRMEPGNRRENFLSVYGPLSLILLLAAWALALVFGFALVQWGFGSQLRTPDGHQGFTADLYMSGTTFFTLGLGDVAPLNPAGRALAVAEAGTGLGFLALVIGYLPTLSQAFSRREVSITLLDARAGSPPSAVELLRRHCQEQHRDALAELLNEWETWSAELLESHVSFPVLAYYRSQHDNQSWVSALTTILDVCAIVIAKVEGGPVRTARLTFAMARHAVVDLCRVFHAMPSPPEPDRLPPAQLARLLEALAGAGVQVRQGPAADEKLVELRRMYEPYVSALGSLLLMPLPPWVPPSQVRDNWQTTA